MATAATASFSSEWQHHHPGAPTPGFVQKPQAVPEADETTKTVAPHILEQTFVSLIEKSLQVHLLDNALWLAERCAAEFPSSPTAVYWLALCQYRTSNLRAARYTLEHKAVVYSSSNDANDDNDKAKQKNNNSAISQQMDYLEALCCFELQDYSRAEECLLRKARAAYREQQSSSSSSTTAGGKNATTASTVAPLAVGTSLDEWILKSCTGPRVTASQQQACPVPNGAAGFCLLAKIFLRSNRKQRAIHFFRASLQLDPFLWTSMEALAELGALEDVSSSSGNGSSSALAALSKKLDGFKQTIHAATSSATMATTTPITRFAPPASPVAHSENEGPRGSSAVPTSAHFAMQTPGLTPIAPSSVSRMQPETPAAGGVGAASTTLSFLAHRGGDASELLPETPAAAPSRQPLQPGTRGDLNHDDSAAASMAAGRFYTPHQSTTQIHSNDEHSSSMQDDPAEEVGDENRAAVTQAPPQQPRQEADSAGGGGTVDPKNGSQVVLRLLRTAATFYQHVCQYRCREALKTMGQLSRKQQGTGWVLHMQGKAFLELNEFTSAQRCLEQMQAHDPCRLDGLELLSTVYWHLKKEVELSHLAQRVLAANRLSAVTWCVVGNCFSLQKDHETALVFFRRSLQIDPNFTYIHTLSGYEYMANEDFDKAIVCFRQALRVNERHYNAWYGLGAIFHRQEKFDLAEYHFERAVQLHPTSSILLCNLGIAQYANGKAYQALDTLAQAFALDPQNPQARFQRASIYAALHRPAEALAELTKVRDSGPREAAVHFAMGKVLKRLGRPQEVISCFLTAMDLDPKDGQIIKSAMDKVGEADVSEESMSTF